MKTEQGMDGLRETYFIQKNKGWWMLDPEITGLRWEYSVEDGRRVGGRMTENTGQWLARGLFSCRLNSNPAILCNLGHFS